MKSFNGPLRIGIGGPVGAGKTNFYEFTRIHTGIFVQYNTGYIY